MKKEEAFLQDSQSQINLSTSSFSEIIPRQQNLIQVRKDKPIVMRSIPVSKSKQSYLINQNTQEPKKQSITLINSTHANTNLSHSNISAQVNKSDVKNPKHFNSANDIENEQKYQEKQLIFNQNLVKSTHEKILQNHQPKQNNQISAKKQQKGQRQEYENVVLDLSLSSMNSQKLPPISPKNPFKMYLDSSPQKQQNPTSSTKEQDLKHYLQAIKQMRRQEQNKNTPIKSQTYQLQTLMKRNHELQARIRQYEELIKTETESMIMERKANQVYTEFYHTLSKMITKFISLNKESFSFPNHDLSEQLNQSLNMEKILITVERLIEGFSSKPIIQTNISQKQVQTDPFQISYPKQPHLKPNEQFSKIHQLKFLLQKAEQKNTLLRSELLQSTQNNINAIFNSQISASCCLENQVTKINAQMTFLKEKMNLLLLKNQPTVVNPPQPLPPQIIYLSQASSPPSNPFNERKENNIVKIYTTKSKSRDSDDESESVEENGRKKRRHSLSRKRKRSSRSERSQSSMSSKSTKKRQQLSMKQLENLKQAYSQTKNELNSLIQTFSLISNSQNQMKGYFTHIKEEIIKSMNEKIKQQEDENKIKQSQRQKEIQKTFIHQRETIQQQVQQEARFNLELTEKMKLKEENYVSHIQSMQQQRQQDRKVIQNLNQKVIELLNAISVPQKVNQQHRKTDPLFDEQIPLSQICVSVDYLKLIQQLKTEKHKQLMQIEKITKENTFLKEEILQLKNIQQRSRVIQNLQDSPNSSNQGQQSIINGLNGFTEMSIQAPPLMINTSSNFNINNDQKSFKTLQSNKHVTFQNNVSSNKYILSMQKIESQKLMKVRTDSQKNLQNNFKVILQSKQSHIKSLQQEIVNLEQTIEYLKGEINSKEHAIEELQTYVLNLENKSLNSITLSSNQINIPQNNLYIDPLNSSEQIKHKYENYVKNLKILLKETRNQNKILKEQLHNFETQIDQQTESNFNMKNSATHSERTTKNFPSSSNVHHAKTNAEIVIRKRVEVSEKYENERQEQRINSLVYENQISQEMDKARTKSKFPAS